MESSSAALALPSLPPRPVSSTSGTAGQSPSTSPRSQILEIEGQVYEALPRPHNSPSYAWFCPVCGEVWARAITGGRFAVWTRPCSKHLDPLLPSLAIPGSIWLAWDTDFTDSLSRELVSRELLLLLAHVERFGYDC